MEKELLTLATKESYFLFDKDSYQQIDGVAMGSPLGPTLANAFLSHHEKTWLENCPPAFKPVFYRRYVDDIFLLFKKPDDLPKFQSYMNSCHSSISFSFEAENCNKMSFLDVEISRENDKFAISVYRKPTFSGVYTHFDSFVPLPFKFSMIFTIIHRCFQLCSNYNKFHLELGKVKNIFKKNGYPISFIDRCIKTFLDKLHTRKIVVTTVEKKNLIVLPYLGIISDQILTKLFKIISKVFHVANLTL